MLESVGHYPLNLQTLAAHVPVRPVVRVAAPTPGGGASGAGTRGGGAGGSDPRGADPVVRFLDTRRAAIAGHSR